MSLLPEHLLLLVAEHAGFAEIQALRATSKTNRKILDDYEHSVTKVNAARYPCPACNHILASDTREREVLPKDTFDVIREFEIRQHNIEELVHGAYLAFWEEYDLQNASKAATIRSNLELALWQCSAIGDLETHSMRYRDGIVPRRDPCVKSLIHQDIILRDAPPPDGWHLALQEVHETHRRDVRLRQIAYIRRLPAQELAGIVVLAHLASQGYMRQRSPSGNMRPEVIEMGVCMAENTIRHGAFFLHAKLNRNRNDYDEVDVGNPTDRSIGHQHIEDQYHHDASGRDSEFGQRYDSSRPQLLNHIEMFSRHCEDAYHHANLLLDDTYEELQRYEAGDSQVLPGLMMTVASTLCDKVGCDRPDLLKAACTLLKGGKWKSDKDKAKCARNQGTQAVTEDLIGDAAVVEAN
ncbi:hypothetical protein CTRI78_v006925 [Colletotrichum trifolii]|uniref:F-box domain-containing protein n=1 Tax=Colletotrichum trifolii TaxID=5466 RepID=A0A4R8RB68_COLTR|nr:hypothetical protein CTRI78_v006925 [Colletotrichum trifolii]